MADCLTQYLRELHSQQRGLKEISRFESESFLTKAVHEPLGCLNLALNEAIAFRATECPGGFQAAELTLLTSELEALLFPVIAGVPHCQTARAPRSYHSHPNRLGDSAVVSTIRAAPPCGPIELKGFWASIMVREGDAWKYRMNIWNITPAPAPPAQTK